MPLAYYVLQGTGSVVSGWRNKLSIRSIWARMSPNLSSTVPTASSTSSENIYSSNAEVSTIGLGSDLATRNRVSINLALSLIAA